MSKPRAFDWSDVNNFLQALFPHYASGIDGDDIEAAAKAADEYLAFCLKRSGSKQRGWTPLQASQMVAGFQKNPQQGCYVNTASLRMGVGFDGTTPALRHQNQYVKGVFFFILDDIGTRTQVSDLPKLLQKPTTSVETSPGNFQFGYRLAQPFRDIFDSRDFITALYSMGKWDGGGAVAAKFVRLPCGINGKTDQGQAIPGKTDFKVNLADINPQVELNPEKVLSAVGYVPTSTRAKKCRLATKMAQQTGQTFVSGDGIADALMPWLESRGQVYSGGDVWQTVICPWHKQHSKGGDITAGYKPLGLGIGDEVFYRRFNCFHDHCKGRRIQDYLKKLEEDHEHFPEGIYPHDPAARLLRDYIYIASSPGYDSGCVVNIDTGQKHNVAGFRNLHAQKMWGKSLAAHFMESKMRPIADDLRSRPDLVNNPNGLVFQIPSTTMTAFNDYRPLDFPEVDPDMAVIQPFLDHADYLMPNPDEREYVLNWMANKIQDPSFRGSVIIMVAPEHGTGRTTWWRMFGELFPSEHYGEISANAFHAQWDDWMTNVLTVCSEVTDKTDASSRWNLSEVFKTRFDTSPSLLDLNIKTRGMLRSHMCCMGFIGLTNHPDAMRIDENDRRIYVVSNPPQIMPSAYFETFFAWKRSEARWRQHLWWWFMRRDLTGWNGCAPAPMTPAKRRMMVGSDGAVGAAVRAVMDTWDHRYIDPRQVQAALKPYAYALMEQVGGVRAKLDKQLRAEFSRHAHYDGVYAQDTLNGKKTDNRKRVDVGPAKPSVRATLALRKAALDAQPDIPAKVRWDVIGDAVAEALVPFGIAAK